MKSSQTLLVLGLAFVLTEPIVVPTTFLSSQWIGRGCQSKKPITFSHSFASKKAFLINVVTMGHMSICDGVWSAGNCFKNLGQQKGRVSCCVFSRRRKRGYGRRFKWWNDGTFCLPSKPDYAFACTTPRDLALGKSCRATGTFNCASRACIIH